MRENNILGLAPFSISTYLASSIVTRRLLLGLNFGVPGYDMVHRGSVEETLNALLDAEADRLCSATLRAQRDTPRYSGRPLRALAADQGRRS
jgi:hypothetical protein